MFELLEKIRQKPERTKKQIAFLTSFFVAGLIFVVWLSVIYPNWLSTKTKEEKVVVTEPSPISTLGNMFSTTFSAIDEQFANIKQAVSSFTTEPAYYSATGTDSEITASSSEIIDPDATVGEPKPII